MTLPPALTWACLFPTDASYLCDNAPMWFLQMLRPFENRSRRVRVTWNNVHCGSLSELDGQVIVNPRSRCETELHRAGFKYIRRFAVLPSLERARWFIPLDSGSISSGAFNIYTPSRRSARLKQLAAKALARTSLGLWYRDHIIVASHEIPPIERTIQELFDNQQIRLALSAGAPEPARNRKPSLAVLNTSGQIVAIAKLGNSTISTHNINHEAWVLGELNSHDPLEARVPRLLFSGEVDGQLLMVQSTLPGKPTPAQLTPAHHELLAALRCGPTIWANESNMIASLEARLINLQSSYAPRLLGALDGLRPTLASLRIPSTVVHGDFTPWNLRQHAGSIAAFDWEYAQLDGLPLIDETHFRLQVGYLLHNWSDKRAAHELHHAAAEAAPLIVMVNQAQALQCVYLIDMLARLLEEGYDPKDEMILWYRRVLRRIAPARPREAVLA